MAQGFFVSGVLQFPVLGLGVEAGTLLGDAGQVAVAEDEGVGIVGLQRLQQGMEGSLLLPRSGVGGQAVGRQAALVADADAVLVVVAGMGADEVLMARLVELAVAGDVVVVAGEAEAGVVAGYEVLDGEAAVAARG